jgi:hypothetical protein
MRSSGSPGSWPPLAAEFRCVSFTLHSHPKTSNLFPEFGGTFMAAAAFDHYAGQLGPALAGPWSPPRTERLAEFDMAIAELVDKDEIDAAACAGQFTIIV